MYSACKLNKQGDNIQPWCTPFPIWNQSVVPCPVLTVASWPAYRTLIIGDWNAKVGNQETPGVTGKFGFGVQYEAGQRLIEFCQENTLVIAKTLFQQHKGRLYTWTSLNGQHWNLTDYILCSQRWRSSIQSAKTRLGADCGSDHELLFAKFRLKLKKVEKTTRPFKYVLNQIPYDYTVEVRNRFKGTDLIDRVPDELWNNRLVPNRKRSTSRLYIVTLLF